MNIKTKLLLFLFLFASALTFTFFPSCSSPTDPSLLPSLTLTVNGVTSTEAFIKLSTNNVSLPANVTLSRNSRQINSFTLITTDTTIVDNNLNPNQSYTYSAELTDADNKRAASVSVLVQTMDTTSHNFTFETYTFGGQGGSSTLFDVAIINENDIWAVGEMYVYDSTGTPVLYNAVHWDGQNWELKRIKYFGQCSAVVYPSLRAIIAFSKNDIIVTNGGSIGFFDGAKIVLDCGVNPLLNGAIKKIWGISSKDFYVVGNKGSIAHYNGSSWQKINSGTDLNVNDIWGDFNKETGKWEILAVASNIFSSFDRAILSINPATRKVTQLSSQPIQYTLKGVWFKSNKQYYVSGDGIFQKNRLVDKNWRNNPLEFTKYFTENIRGNDVNNIMAVGDFGELIHFNGMSWKSLRNDTSIKDGIYYSIAIKGNTVVTVGLFGQKAILLMGKR